jgi:large subunit ribosomal protein L10
LRTALGRHVLTHPEFKPLVRYIRGELGIVFTNKNIFYIKDKIESEKTPMKAKINARATDDIIIPSGDSILPCGGNNYHFGPLNIPTKTMNARVHFIHEVILFRKGDLISEYGFDLLNALNMKPIHRRVMVTCAYDSGMIFDEKTLNEAQRIPMSFSEGIQNIAAISVAIGTPNISSIMHIIRNGLMNVQAVSIGFEGR